MTAIALAGSPAEIDAYLSSPAGRHVARELAAAVFADADSLAAYETGANVNLPSAAEAELNTLIETRNAAEERWMREEVLT